jgi:D-serine deaminase-like pyridoxal phosphate-dependent protein
VIDKAVMTQNLQRMADYCRLHGLQLRPHIKTHKSKFMAKLQLDYGACGLTVAKSGEAKVMSEVCGDILVAYPILDPFRVQLLALVAKKNTVRIAVDSSHAIQTLNESAQTYNSHFHILIDTDVGYHRTGVQSPEQALELAKLADSSLHLTLDGLFCYYGHISSFQPNEQEPHLKTVSEKLRDVLSLWKENGIEAKVVSGGTTPSAYQSHLIPEITEIRPGTYIYNDRNSISSGFCELSDCAASIYTTVVSTSVPGKVVVDAGSKTLTSDRLIHNADTAGHGLVVEYPNAVITRLTEEHGEIDITKCSVIPKLGDVLRIIPNHICPCINLQDNVYLLHSSEEYEQLKVDARGMVV